MDLVVTNSDSPAAPTPVSAAMVVIDRGQIRRWFYQLGRSNQVPPHVIDWCWSDFESRHLWVLPGIERVEGEIAAEAELGRYPADLVAAATGTIELRFVRERVAMVRTFLSIEIALYRATFGDWTTGQA